MAGGVGEEFRRRRPCLASGVAVAIIERGYDRNNLNANQYHYTTKKYLEIYIKGRGSFFLFS
jgi:hypothetical protein